MAKYGIVRGRNVLDPTFNIQEGDLDSVYAPTDIDAEQPFDELEENVETGGLETPQILEVIQKYRQDDSGRTVVDVILIVEDIGGIVKYDTRIGIDSDPVYSGGT